MNTGVPQNPPTVRPPVGTGLGNAGTLVSWSPSLASDHEANIFDPGLEGESNPGGALMAACNEATVDHPTVDRIVPCGLSAVIVENHTRLRKEAHCSGVIISPLHIVTAAHCLAEQGPDVKESFLIFDPTSDFPEPRDIGVAHVVERYGQSKLSPLQDGFYETPDLVLLKIKEKPERNERFTRVRIPRIFVGDNILNREMIAIGYGENPSREATGIRQIAVLGAIDTLCRDLNFTGRGECDPEFEFVHSNIEDWKPALERFASLETTARSSIRSSMIDGQTAGRRFMPDTCNGDSGGPIFISDDVAWSVVAITSRAIVPDPFILPNTDGCKGHGGIYVRLGEAKIIDWITSHLEASGCPAVKTDESVRFPVCEKQSVHN